MISVLFALSLAPACAPQDHDCRAGEYIQASQHGDPTSRVRRLYNAHREYLFAYDETRKPEALCRARKALTEAKALKPTPERLAPLLQKTEDEMAAREREAGVLCGPQAAERVPDRRLARRPKQAPALEPPSPVPSPTEERGESPLLDVEAGTSGRRSPPRGAAVANTVPLVAVVERPRPAPTKADPRPEDLRRGRFRAAGAAFTGLSAGLLGVLTSAVVMGVRDVHAIREQTAEVSGAERPPTAFEQEHVQRLIDDGQVWRGVAAGVGAGALVSLVSGVVFLVASKPRARAKAPRLYSGPRSMGFVIRF